MSNTGVGGLRAQGDVIVERLVGEVKTPKELAPSIADFSREHAQYRAAGDAATAAELKRDTALGAVADADAGGLDPSIDALANAMVGASMGKRTNAFKGFSPYAPGAMKELAYAKEVAAVQALVGAVREAKPNAAVGKALDACEAHAATVTTKLKALTAAQTRYDLALGARDKFLPAWSRALARLKKKATGAWADEPETYRAVFAPPDAVRAPVVKRPKKKAKKPTPPAAPPTA